MIRFTFDFDRSYRLAALPFGITPGNSWVEVDRDEMQVKFGPWSLRTPLTNITDNELSGDFAFIKTAGPPHLSLSDRGVTFATNGRRAVCLSFATPVKGIDPTGIITHPNATLTVSQPEELRRLVN